MRAPQGLRDGAELEAHIGQARHRAHGVVGVDRGQHQVAGHGGLGRRHGGLLVADLAHQDHVGVLAQHGAQGRRRR